MAKTPVIAIVDDDEGVRASLASLVRSLGYEAHAYESGVAFLREPAGEDPACMIADVQMPVIPGDELQARLVASGRHFPIIGVGGIDSPEAALSMRHAGADLIQVYTGLIYRGPSLVTRTIRAVGS